MTLQWFSTTHIQGGIRGVDAANEQLRDGQIEARRAGRHAGRRAGRRAMTIMWIQGSRLSISNCLTRIRSNSLTHIRDGVHGVDAANEELRDGDGQED